MRVIVTGGSGLIGRALVARLAADGHAVTVVSRSPDRARAKLPAGVEAVAWDGRTAAAGWGARVDGADAVVNLAGEGIADGRWTDERKRRILDSRVQAGQAVTAAVAAAAVKPKVVVQASAVGYYGTRRPGDLVESSPPGDDFLARVCVAWEGSTAPVAAMGVRHVVTRFGVVLSADGGAFPQMALPFKLFAGGPIGTGRQPLPWVHIDDVVGAIVFLIEQPDAEGAFNVTGPQALDNAAFGRVVGRVLGRPAFIPTPGFVLKLVFGELSMMLLEGQQPVPERLLALGYPFRFAEAEAAVRDVVGRDVVGR